MAATVMSTGVPVGASGADSVNGLFWRDLNASGQLGDTDPTTFGAMPEGPLEGVVLNLSGPSGSFDQTTGPDGLYSFDGLDAGAYTLHATYPTGYKAGALGVDSDLTNTAPPIVGEPATATATVVVTAGGEVVFNGAVAPLPILTLDVADLDPGVAVIPAIETGRPDFDTMGACATDTDPPIPGDDCSAEDGYVRTNDLTSMTFSITADNILDPSSSPLNNVIFEQIITPTAGADVEYYALPNVCLTSGVTPASSITVDADRSITLTCNMGTFRNELKLMAVSIKALGTSSNGASFTTQQRVYQVEDAAIPADPYPGITTQISAAPRFDITKGTSPENPFNRTIYGQTTLSANPHTGVIEYGVNYYFDITALYDGGIVGQEALEGPITFSDIIDPKFSDWKINGCNNSPYPSSSLPTGTSVAEDWGSHGTWTCTADYTNNKINFTVTGVDTDGAPLATEGANGTDLSAGPYVAFGGRVSIWYPLREFYESVDPSWVEGDDPIYGDYPLLNSVGDFDPTSASGVSNYGDGVESDSNNSTETSVAIYNRGGFSKQVGSYEWADGRVSSLYDQSSVWPCNSDDEGALMESQTGCGAGDGPIQPGQSTSWWFWFRNSGTDSWPSESLLVCDAFDNSTQTLTNWTFGGNIVARNGGIDSDAIRIEYATGNFGDDVANNDWTNQTSAVETCTAPLDDWTTDPTTIGIDNVGMIRITVDETIEPEILPSEYIQVAFPTTARDTYYGGPNDGEQIEVGVYVANLANRAFSTTPLATTANSDQIYRPATNANTPYGDRLIFNRHQVRIDKRTSLDELGDDLLEQVDAGDPVVWTLHPSVTAVTGGAIAENVTVTDVLPQYIKLDRACQASQVLPEGVTLTSVTDGPGEGETTLVFDLGDRVVNEAIGMIPVCTISDTFAPPSTDAVNHVEIESDGDVSPENARSDDRPIRILQTGAFVVGKTVDSPLELQNSTQEWTIGWQNLSASLPFAPPDVIDVLPYNGDFGNALNGRSEFDSQFSSTIGLTSFLPLPKVDQGSGTLSDSPGTWYYTKADSATISHDPRSASNDLADAAAATTWCTEAEVVASATPVCGFLLSEVTAIRFVSSGNLMPGDTVSVSYTTAAGIANGSTTNAPRDRYVNRFAAYSTTFPNQLIRSQEVIVQVLSMSIGDLVFQDADIDGKYTPGIDSPIPGVFVELHDFATGDLVADTTTNADGRYLFPGLLEGVYEIVIPASEFAVGGPLEDLDPTVLPSAPDLDSNEGIDQHARPGPNGSATSERITLDPDTSDDPPIGREPTGDDVAGIEDPLTYDNLSNLTVDMGFAGDPAIELIKQVCLLEDVSTCDIADDAHWGEHSDAAINIPFDGAWRMTVTNIGNQVLTDVQVTDPLVPNCDATSAEVPELAQIIPGGSVAYTCVAFDLGADMTNVATVTSTAPGGIEPTDEDDASIEAPEADPSIDVTKYVADLDANVAPGPAFTPGDPVVWTYAVENTGNVAFTSLDLTDDNGTPDDDSDDQKPVYVDGDTNSDGILDLDETWWFTMSGVAATDQYTNIGDVIGTGTWSEVPFEATDDDPANNFGVAADVEIVKYVNGQDANTTPGPYLASDETANFTYEVTNTGNTFLDDIVVTDDQGVVVTCPLTTLPPDGTMTCTGSEPAAQGQYTNIGDVIGTPALPSGLGVLTPLVDSEGELWEKPVDDDPANYFGGNPDILIIKSVDGDDANEAPGIFRVPGDPVEFTYEVTNTGGTALIDLVVNDDQGVVVTCPETTLLAGESMTCTGPGEAVVGQYTNIGDVVGTPAAVDSSGELVPLTNSDGSEADKLTDDDPANVYGVVPDIDITKYVAGHDANEAPGIHLPEGDPVEWTYVVTNTGNTWLSDIGVVDDQGVIVTCPLSVLEPEQSMTCVGAGTVSNGEYVNIGEATGKPSWPSPEGEPTIIVDINGEELPPVIDDDPANNFGYINGITIIKRVFGEDAPVGEEVYVDADTVAPFTYEVTNTGNTWLDDLTVTDDQGVEVTCPVDILAPGETTMCTGEGPVPAGSYTNIGVATGTPTIETPGGPVPVTNPDTGEPVEKPTDDDDANLYGEDPGLELVKVPCYEGKCGEGLSVPDDGIITWRITVTNTGNVTLYNVLITDNLVASCDRSLDSLNPGETVNISCEAAASVTRTNSAEVTGQHVSNATDPGGIETQTTTELSDEGTGVVGRRTAMLAFTGAETGFMLAIGFWLTIGGAGLVFLSRRRKTLPTS